MSRYSSFLHFFGLAANGKTEDEVRRLAEDAAPMFDEDTAPEHEPEGEAIPEEDSKPTAPAIDVDGLAKAIADAVIAALAPQTEAEEAPEAEEKDPLDDALETIGKEIKGETDCADEDPAEDPGAGEDEATAESEEAHVIPAEEMDKDEEGEKAMDAQTAKAVIMAMRPAIAGITNEAERKAATDALLALVKRPAVNDAAKIAQAAAKNAQTRAEQKPVTDLDAIQKLYDSRNPHKKEG